MTNRTSEASSPATVSLNVFCAREANAWRVHLGSSWLPPNLLHLFDARREAFPVQLDFDDLERFMSKHAVAFKSRLSTLGDVELYAEGRAASVLARWLANAFGSDVRPPPR